MPGNKYLYVVLALIMSFNLNAKTCVTAIPETTPIADFTENNDGTVTHHKTGLVWQMCSQGQVWEAGSCTGAATTHTWQQALQIPASLNVSGGYAGYSDWRLPNITELLSIAELRCGSPAINESIFPVTESLGFWSSSPEKSSFGRSWFVHFNDGSNYYNSRDSSHQVRLVRCCSSNFSGTINPDSTFDGTYDLSVTSNTQFDINGLPCMDASGTMMIINLALSGSVIDGWGESYDISGDVQPDSTVNGGFAVSGTNAATFEGSISDNVGSGTWQDIYQCAGTWQAIKN